MKEWIKRGGLYVIITFIGLAFVIPYFRNEDISIQEVLMKLAFCIIGGLIWRLLTTNNN